MKKPLITTSVVATAALLLIGAGCTGSTTAPSNPTTTKTTANTATTNANTNAANTNKAADAAVTFDAKASTAEILADANGQWANTATASSEYGTDSWAAKQATGKPNVTAFGDNGNAWAPYEKAGGKETLELTFKKAVTPVGVRILESYGNGTLTKVEVKDVAGEYHEIWAATDTTSGLEYLQIAIAGADYEANGVKLTFDTSDLTDEWAEIDAVQLVGE